MFEIPIFQALGRRLFNDLLLRQFSVPVAEKASTLEESDSLSQRVKTMQCITLAGAKITREIKKRCAKAISCLQATATDTRRGLETRVRCVPWSRVFRFPDTSAIVATEALSNVFFHG